MKVTQSSLQAREERFKKLISDGISPGENQEIILSATAQGLQVAAGLLKLVSAATSQIPELTTGGAGAFGSPVLVAEVGGGKIASGFEYAAMGVEATAGVLQLVADVIGKNAGYARREEEWQSEKNTTKFDLDEIKHQIASAEIQLAIANQEITIDRRTIQQQQEIERFYRSKFSNQALYSWMVGRLSGLYFQTYQLAYAMAKSAEKGLQYELPTTDTFITPTHWDNTRKGLLAGESLRLQLNRMEQYHLSQDSRFLEVEKTISMRSTQLADQPIYRPALALLLLTGECEFQLSEQLFNQDFPGHYFRVIKSIELEIITTKEVQPYDSVSATLIQLSNKSLLSPDISGVRYLMGESTEAPDPSIVRSNWRANQQIAVSKPNTRDDGMFILNFFLDDRYFPFEGTGLISNWRLEIPPANNRALRSDNGQLAIREVLLHIRYTAKADRGSFKDEVDKLR